MKHTLQLLSLTGTLLEAVTRLMSIGTIDHPTVIFSFKFIKLSSTPYTRLNLIKCIDIQSVPKSLRMGFVRFGLTEIR